LKNFDLASISYLYLIGQVEEVDVGVSEVVGMFSLNLIVIQEYLLPEVKKTHLWQKI